MCHVWICRSTSFAVDTNTEFTKEIFGELITFCDAEFTWIENNLFVDVEIFNCVESVIVWWRPGNSMSSDQSACAKK